MTVVAQEPHTQAITAALTADGLLVGAGVEPDGAGWQGPPGASVFRGYCVIHPIPGGTRQPDGGMLTDVERDAQLVWQVTCVAASQRQCERLADRVSAVMAAGVTVEGRRILTVRHDFGSNQARRDDDPLPGEPALFIATPRFRLWTTTA